MSALENAEHLRSFGKWTSQHVESSKDQEEKLIKGVGEAG
jgi:hypothetical protein